MSASLIRETIIKSLKQFPRSEQLAIIADVLREMAQQVKAEEEQKKAFNANPDEKSPDIKSS
jgi:hypothetical protein